jgi:hypothetical protein
VYGTFYTRQFRTREGSLSQVRTLHELTPAERELRSAISNAILNSGKSREAVARELSAALGYSIGPRSLENYISPSRSNYRVPAAWVAPLCEITGDRKLQEIILGPRLSRVLKLGEQEIAAHRAKMAILGDMDKPAPGTRSGGTR